VGVLPDKVKNGKRRIIMCSVEKIIESVSLPLVLSENAFMFSIEGNEVDPLYLINELPENLRYSLNLDDYVSIKRYDEAVVYRFTLLDGGYLKIKLQSRAIVEFTIVHGK
jgi:hypothetical protein